MPQSPSHSPTSEAVSSDPVPKVAFVANLNIQGAFGYLSSGWPIAYLVATVVVSIGIAIAAVTYVSHSEQIVHQSDNRVPSPSPALSVVGRITEMADCVWEKGSVIRVQGAGGEGGLNKTSALHSLVSLGDRLDIRSGLLEITYDTGAKVILQGPVTYDVESKNGGYMSFGKLTGKVPNEMARGLMIRTPTAIVTDLGTEFGVEVDRQGTTTSHVFLGSVNVQYLSTDGKPAGDSRVLHKDETAVVKARGEAPRIVSIQGFTASRFVRDIPGQSNPRIKAFDLADVVAGGDGFSGQRGRGIDSSNGRPTTTTVKEYHPDRFPIIVGDGKYHAVDAMALIDGVFIPDGRSGAVQVDSAAHTFADFPVTSNTTAGNIWAGGTIPVPSRSMPPHVAAMLASSPPSQTLLPTKLDHVDYATPGHGLIFLHANNGITFKLDAIRRANPGCKLLRFLATAGNVEPVSEKGEPAGYADLWVLVDGQVRFRRREINGCSGAFKIVFPIAESDRFLTLAATDGGNTMAGDWILFGDPVLEMATAKVVGQTNSRPK